jgi:hypothetical protein
MMIVIATVVFASLVIVGMLIGMSLHREATRRRRKHLHREERMLADLREDDLARRRYTLEDVRRRSGRGSWV